MEQINDLYKVINNKYSDSNNSLYQEIMNREENVRNTLDRVVKMKETEKLKEVFTKKSIDNITINIFKNLNSILEEVNNIDRLTYKEFKKIMNKDNRIIYTGLFFIIIAISLLLIEISDNI
jgi:hypothetical protein